MSLDKLWARLREYRFVSVLVSCAVAPMFMAADCGGGPYYISTLTICGTVTKADGTKATGPATFSIMVKIGDHVNQGSVPVTLDSTGYGCGSGSPGLGAQEGNYELKSLSATISDNGSNASVEGWLVNHNINDSNPADVSLELDANFDFRNPNDNHSGFGEVAALMNELMPSHGSGVAPAAVSGRTRVIRDDAIAIGEPSENHQSGEARI